MVACLSRTSPWKCGFTRSGSSAQALEDNGAWAAWWDTEQHWTSSEHTQPSSLILGRSCCLYKGLIICPAPKPFASSGPVGESAKIYWEVDSLHCHWDIAKNPIPKYGNLLASFPASSSLLIPKEQLPSLSCPPSKSQFPFLLFPHFCLHPSLPHILFLLETHFLLRQPSLAHFYCPPLCLQWKHHKKWIRGSGIWEVKMTHPEEAQQWRQDTLAAF